MAGSDEPVYPIGFIQYRIPIALKHGACIYSQEGRKGLHDNLRVNAALMRQLEKQPLYGRSVEYADNRISLFTAQWGKCSVTGREFQVLRDIHCHHIHPKWMGGTDEYGNLTLVLAPVHILIHAKDPCVIEKYLKMLKLNNEQLRKLNKLRILAGLSEI